MQVVAMESGMATAWHPETGRSQILFPREINTVSLCEPSWNDSLLMAGVAGGGNQRESTRLQTQL